MIDFKKKTVCVVDHGMSVHVAIKLAQYFGEVLYYTMWECAFPTCEPLLVGEGFPGVTRAKYFWKECGHADLFVFCDVYTGDLQSELIRRGCRVWGPRWGEELEIYRWKTKKLLPKIGLPEPPGELIKGFSNLKSFLKENENKFVKVSGLRGMLETFHHINYDLSEFELDTLERNLSSVKETINFIVDDPIPEDDEETPTVEIGYDGWAIDDKFPEIASGGYETKDAGLVSFIRPWSEFPEPIREVMNAFRPVLQDYQYRGFCCAEIRVNKNGNFMTDFAARPGSPSGEALMEVFSNWPEIMWHGAEGKLVKPEQVANFSVEVVMHSDHSSPEDWKVIQIDEAVRPWVKLHCWARVEGRDIICPQEYPLKEFGAVVGIGDTLQEAIKKVKEHCEGVKGSGIHFNVDKIEEGLKEISEGESLGIDFGTNISVDEKPKGEEVS